MFKCFIIFPKFLTLRRVFEITKNKLTLNSYLSVFRFFFFW